MKTEGTKINEGQRTGEMDGYIIFDVSGTFVPYSQFLLGRWGCVVLSSPNTKNFAEWAKQNNALPIYINCYSRREIMGFHAFQERCVLRTDEEYIGAREQIESRWTEIRRRIREVARCRVISLTGNYLTIGSRKLRRRWRVSQKSIWSDT
ncbi:putative retrotransposon hot spot protein 4 (RHS4) [Trypanosoma vivax]|nr:putative retrotransposon hot spot protein 4 (RHS4) [Trypanosoma vivax]